MSQCHQVTMGDCTIALCDCLEYMRGMATGSVDAVITDPPFFLPAKISTSRRTWPRTLADLSIMNFYFRQIFDECVRLLRRSGAFYTFSDSTSYAVFLTIAYPLFDRTQCIAWDKVNGGLGNGWRHSNELILHGAFNTTQYVDGFRRDVLSAKVVPSSERDHASEKPVSLVADLLSAHSQDVTVFDPFMGSGTTGVACVQTGRRFLGVEIDPGYFEIARKRIADAQARPRLFADDAPPPAPTQGDLLRADAGAAGSQTEACNLGETGVKCT